MAYVGLVPGEDVRVGTWALHDGSLPRRFARVSVVNVTIVFRGRPAWREEERE